MSRLNYMMQTKSGNNLSLRYNMALKKALRNKTSKAYVMKSH